MIFSWYTVGICALFVWVLYCLYLAIDAYKHDNLFGGSITSAVGVFGITLFFPLWYPPLWLLNKTVG